MEPGSSTRPSLEEWKKDLSRAAIATEQDRRDKLMDAIAREESMSWQSPLTPLSPTALRSLLSRQLENLDAGRPLADGAALPPGSTCWMHGEVITIEGCPRCAGENAEPMLARLSEWKPSWWKRRWWNFLNLLDDLHINIFEPPIESETSK